MSLSLTSLSLMTSSQKGLFVTLSTYSTLLNIIMLLNIVMLSVVMLDVVVSIYEIIATPKDVTIFI